MALEWQTAEGRSNSDATYFKLARLVDDDSRIWAEVFLPLDAGGSYDCIFYCDFGVAERRYTDLFAAQAACERVVELAKEKGYDVVDHLERNHGRECEA